MFHQPAAFPNVLHTHTQSFKTMKIENTKMKRHHPSPEQQEQEFSADDPCIQETCDEDPLKSKYDSSHDDSSDDSFHFEYESFAKRSKFYNGRQDDEVAGKVGFLKTEQLKTEHVADDYDNDSVNDNLRREIDKDGMYAFCCCNCR
jgi:hypothetical protein